MYDYNNKSKGKQVKEAVPTWSQNCLFPVTIWHVWLKNLPVKKKKSSCFSSSFFFSPLLQLGYAPTQELEQEDGEEEVI